MKHLLRFFQENRGWRPADDGPVLGSLKLGVGFAAAAADKLRTEVACRSHRRTDD